MCRNHSHITGRIYALTNEDDVTEVKMLVTQDLTLETSSGLDLKLPQYAVCYVRLVYPVPSLVSQLQQMVAQEGVGLSKAVDPTISGLTTPPK